MRWKMPVGIEDFRELRQGPYYFVDKTDFIRRLLDDHSKVTLFTRPRRFGKTLTMSMLEWFFSLEKADESGSLFDGLAISKEAAYMQQRGQYPVLFVSLKDLKDLTWPQMLDSIGSWISNWFIAHEYLATSEKIDDVLRQRFLSLKRQEAGQNEMQLALAILLKMMHQHFGKPVILLIDEYDAPIQQAWENGFYKEAIAFMKTFLGSVLKGNPDLSFAVLTGVLRVAKESIFSDLNNLDVCSLLRDKYSDVFGFTEAEVGLMLQSLQKEGKLPELKQWYDGYRIGRTEIYNPWSVINYIGNGCLPRAYWVRTSGNSILRSLLVQADELRIKMVRSLLDGRSVRVTLDESVIYPEIGQNQGALFTLLLTTGYLTVAEVISESDDRYALRIPNEEIRKLYSTEILNSLAQGVTKNAFDDLFDYLVEGNGEDFARQLEQIMKAVVSVYDTANKESFYHGFMLGMTALFLGKDYTVESNRESGYGRFDLAIFPQAKEKAGVVMEFKVAEKEVDLPGKAAEALQQIEEKGYLTAFRQRKIKDVWKYGIAFCGKKVCVEEGGKEQ